MKVNKVSNLILVILFAITALMARQYDVLTIERAVWTTIGYSLIFIAGIILIFKPHYFFKEHPSRRTGSKILGVLFLILSIVAISSVWHF